MNAEDPRIYVRVLLHVREQIICGKLSPGQPAPTITSLCGRFDCTRQTAAKALQLLASEETLIRYPGLGYYVARVPAEDRRPAPAITCRRPTAR